jgi:hypothetical protein
MAQLKRTEARLREIKRRQWEQRWGENYIAAVFADASEAPGISTGSILRDFHAMSDPESFIGLLALYSPLCWDIHEQFVMFPNAREHPLQNHPMALGQRFKSFAGTLDVFERLGLSRHQSIRVAIGADGLKQKVPFPYLGDLRLFLRDDQGVYCLNWSVKNKYVDFRGKGPRAKPRPLNDPDDPSSIARQEFECVYHDDAGIRTQQVALDQLDTEVRLNLRNTFLDECRPLALPELSRQQALGVARDHIGEDVPMHVVARRMAQAVECVEGEDAIALIHQGIWRRELRVDLFRPILTTKPLRPEIRDVLNVYGSWFVR